MEILKNNGQEADNYAFLELDEELNRIQALYPKERFGLDAIKYDSEKCPLNHIESFKMEKFIVRCTPELSFGKVEGSKSIKFLICPHCYIGSL